LFICSNMAQTSERLRRLIADEVGSCCAADVDDRLADLRELEEGLPPERERDRDVAALKALANDTRYRLVRALVAAEGELCVCEFDPLVDVSESAISHALSTLTDAGLVTRRKEGKWRYYRATDRAARLMGTLDATRDDDAGRETDR
jgi:DNA-binding transcriptional ArsR family regulator